MASTCVALFVLLIKLVSSTNKGEQARFTFPGSQVHAQPVFYPGLC